MKTCRMASPFAASSIFRVNSTVSFRISVDGVRKNFQPWFVLNAPTALRESTVDTGKAMTCPTLASSASRSAVINSIPCTLKALVLLITTRVRCALRSPTEGFRPPSSLRFFLMFNRLMPLVFAAESPDDVPNRDT